MPPNTQSPKTQSEDQEFAAGYEHTRKDVRAVAIINLLMIALLAGLYFLNKKIGFLSKLLDIF